MQAKKVILSPDALFQDIDGEGVILDLQSASYYGVDGVGVRLWQLLQTNPDLASAMELLAAEYDVTREQLEQDIHRFIDEMIGAGLAKTE